MAKLSLGLCLGEEEYAKRFHALLMNHYRQQFGLFVYSKPEEIPRDQGRPQALLLSDWDCKKVKELLEDGGNIFYLRDAEEEDWALDGVISLEKYQKANLLVEQILRQMGENLQGFAGSANREIGPRFFAVYGLSETEFELPFALTLASILGEKEKTLIVDLQENSGLKQYGRPDNAPGLEDLFLLGKKGGDGSLLSLRDTVGHLDRVDYVFPVENSESLCEADCAMYDNLLQLLKNDLTYETVIFNLGPRFVGFFETLNQCQQIFLLQKHGGISRWREKEFFEEIEKKGYENLKDRICKVEIPVISGACSSCDSLVEQWKWNDFGDIIRKLTMQGAYFG